MGSLISIQKSTNYFWPWKEPAKSKKGTVLDAHTRWGTVYGTYEQSISMIILQQWWIISSRVNSALVLLKTKTRPKGITVFPNKCIPEQSLRKFIGIQKYPGPNKVKFTMSSSQSKIGRHTNRQKNNSLNENHQLKLIQNLHRCQNQQRMMVNNYCNCFFMCSKFKERHERYFERPKLNF